MKFRKNPSTPRSTLPFSFLLPFYKNSRNPHPPFSRFWEIPTPEEVGWAMEASYFNLKGQAINRSSTNEQ